MPGSDDWNQAGGCTSDRARGRPGDGAPTSAPLSCSHPVELPLAELRTGMSPRTGRPDANHARALAETFDDLPPILVHGETRTVIDGAHRLLAARFLGRSTIPAVIFDGTEEAAYVEAVRRNTQHGRPLTVSEREQAAARILAACPEWSDRRVGAVCGLSPKSVARIRKRSTEEAAQLTARVGRDGRRRPTDPAAVRLLVAELLRRQPDASLSSIATSACTSRATVQDVRRRLLRGQSPLPARLETGPTCSSPADGRERATARWCEDAAMCSTPQGRAFATWLDGHDIRDEDWHPYLDVMPVNRLYLLAAETLRRAECWRRLAEALEQRVRDNSGSPH